MKNTSGKTKRIGKHYFRLIGRDHLYFKGQHIVSFAPLTKRNRPDINTKQLKNRIIVPTFNHDRKYYTYAFTLPSSTPDKDQQLLEEHHKRTAEALHEQSQPLMPKPRSRHKYCGVCRNHYEDYKEHVESEPHLLHLKNSKYQELISQLCLNYRQLIQKKESEEVKIIDLTMEEASIKAPSEIIETMSASRTILT